MADCLFQLVHPGDLVGVTTFDPVSPVCFIVLAKSNRQLVGNRLKTGHLRVYDPVAGAVAFWSEAVINFMGPNIRIVNRAA